MPAEEVSIEQYKAARISMFLDANVSVNAIRGSTRGGQWRDLGTMSPDGVFSASGKVKGRVLKKEYR